MATSEESEPVRLVGQHVHAAEDSGETHEVSEELSEQALLEDLARSDAALVRANESIVRAVDAVESARRGVQRAQRALDRRSENYPPEPTAGSARADTTPT